MSHRTYTSSSKYTPYSVPDRASKGSAGNSSSRVGPSANAISSRRSDLKGVSHTELRSERAAKDSVVEKNLKSAEKNMKLVEKSLKPGDKSTVTKNIKPGDKTSIRHSEKETTRSATKSTSLPEKNVVSVPSSKKNVSSLDKKGRSTEKHVIAPFKKNIGPPDKHVKLVEKSTVMPVKKSIILPAKNIRPQDDGSLKKLVTVPGNTVKPSEKKYDWEKSIGLPRMYRSLENNIKSKSLKPRDKGIIPLDKKLRPLEKEIRPLDKTPRQIEKRVRLPEKNVSPEKRLKGDKTKSDKPVGECEHLEKFKRGGGIPSYSKIYTNFVIPLTKKAKQLKSRSGKCHICRHTYRVHTCLNCVHFACTRKGHLKKHYLTSGHSLAFDVVSGSTYCFKCCDVFFDRDLVKIGLEIMKKLEWADALPAGSGNGITATASRRKYTKMYSNSLCTSPQSTLGLRGLINLGHTCFMSCIVQSLIHTPMLRDYFLATKIVCDEKHDANNTKPCIVGLVGDLYQEFFNGLKTPVSLHGLLFKIWGNAAHLAGYEQQDAHEFFIAMLDALHLHFHQPDNNGICTCVIDIIFLGRLQSAVTCLFCGHKSITVDPFWDTSLDLTNDDTSVTLKLEDCLDRYTRVEHLGSSGMIWCSICGENQESTKQLKFQTLPMVLCLHLKRFEHRTSYKKIDTRVEFPESLFMHEYTSEYGETGNKTSSSNELTEQSKKDDYKYSLYAVVNHVGSLDGGHYYAFIRHVSTKNWFKCDDHWITRATQAEVLSSPGYLLFYHKEVLNYDESTSALSPSAQKKTKS